MLKSRIVDVLGEKTLLLPHLIEAGLGADARAKYLFALLGAAQAHAEQPAAIVADLHAERLAAGLDDASLDRVVMESRRVADGVYTVPQVARIHADIVAALEEMERPLAVAGGDDTAVAAEAERRRVALAASLAPASDQVDRSWVAGVTAAGRGKRGDSMHRLVMDLHKALLRLQARIAVDRVEGAATYALEPGDRALVAAFMRGLNATAPLKFDHPGLGTTATRRGHSLVIQNDIGTTDAHVILVEVSGHTTTVRYTDVHARRVRFFQSLFEPWSVAWAETRTERADELADGTDFYVCTGRHEARSSEELERYLAFLGSRIVFLIDWNRARKRLRYFVGGAESVEVLRWAASHDVGHRAFLQAGGEALLYAVIETAGRGAIRYGQRLDEALGPEAAAEYLRFVLRTCTEGLRAGRSLRLIRDEIEAELRNCFRSAEQAALEIACDHAALIAEIAGVVQGAVLRLAGAGAAEQEGARRAKVWETRADGLLNRLREMCRGTRGAAPYRDVTEHADDGADCLEEAAFLLTLARSEPPRAVLGALERLAAEALLTSREYVKTVECATIVQAGGAREDINDFLEAVDRTVELEHATDETERQVLAGLARGGDAAGPAWLYVDLASCLEESADALARSALMLRDHLLAEVIAH